MSELTIPTSAFADIAPEAPHSSVPKKRPHLPYVHKFRAFAIMGIVAAHTLPSFDWPKDSVMFEIGDTLFNQSSIWFFFIAGFLFQYLSYNFEPKKYYISKLKNVILPYLILSIPALVASVTFYQQHPAPDHIYEYSIPVQMLLFLVTGGHLAPFWFVPAVSLIYLIAPLLVRLDRMRWPYLFLPIMMIFSGYIGRAGLRDLLDLSNHWNQTGIAVYLLSAYVFGMLCSRYLDQMLDLTKRYWFPLAVVSVVAAIANIVYFDEQVYLIYIFKMAATPLIIYLLSLRPNIGGKTTDFVGDISFGIFFIHGYLLAADKVFREKMFGEALLPPNLLLYAVYTVAIFVMTCLILWVGKRVLGTRSRMVLGT